MHRGLYVSYYRVSTSRQGKSGLGLDAQVQTIKDRLNGGDWEIVDSFTEIETATGKRARPELAKALASCRLKGAKLIVANVARLTRNPDFMAALVAANVEVEFCDLPNTEGPVGKFMLRQMLSVAELEAGMIAERTRKALVEARKRGVKLGGDRGNLPRVAARGRERSLAVRRERVARRLVDLRPTILEIQAAGATSPTSIARELARRGIQTSQKRTTWSATQVSRILAQMGEER